MRLFSNDGEWFAETAAAGTASRRYPEITPALCESALLRTPTRNSSFLLAKYVSPTTSGRTQIPDRRFCWKLT
jgi:hypothetical protein